MEDLTAANVEILVHLTPGVSSDKTLDALYAFTDCEISISPNCCVIKDRKPQFLSVSDVLRSSADQTMELLRRELQIRRDELLEQLFLCSLERIFIEERIYKDKKYENAVSVDAACEHIDERLTPYYPQLVREVRKEDILRLMEIKMKRILKFSKDQADELIAKIKAEIAEIERDLGRMVEITCDWFEHLKNKYGAEHPRLTEIRSFDTIEAAKVVEANEKLYIDRQEGFIGTGLKKAEFVCNCSDIDDIIVFYRDGKYRVIKVADKIDVGKNILHLQVWKKGDKRTIYNCVYRDGKMGSYYVKRFFVDTSTRDRDYDLTQGTKDSRVVYFTANPNGEAEVIKVTHEPGPRIKKIFFDYDFSVLAVKGRGSKGNLLTRFPVHKIGLKSHGHSTLGGREVWWDADVNRLNYDAHGESLGKFLDGDSILVVLDNGDFYITTPDPNNHFEQNIKRIEKWDEHKPWTAVVLDEDNNGNGYIKRFEMEAIKNHRSFLGDNPKNTIMLLTDTPFPRIKVTFGGKDASREPVEIDCEEFIAVKGFKAKGKRISTFKIDKVEELEPTRFPEPETPEGDDGADGDDSAEENLDPDAGKSQQQVRDEMTGQLNLF